MIRVAWARLFGYRSFWRFVLLHAGIIVVVNYVASRFTNVAVQGSSVALGNLYAFPDVWGTIDALARWVYFVPALFVIQLICAEFELRLVRQQVILGLERRALVAMWTVQNALLVAFGLLATVATAALLGRHDANTGFDFGAMLAHQAGFALYGLAFLAAALLAAVLIRRPVPAALLLVLWPMMIEPIIGYSLEHEGLANAGNFLPFAAFSTLAPWPNLGKPFDLGAPTTYASIAYALIATGLAWWRLEMLDL